MAESFPKQPGSEQYLIAVEFDGLLPTGASLSSGTVSAINTSTGLDATADVLDSTTATIVGTQAQAFVKGGVHGYDYKITFVVLLTPGSPVPTLEEDITMMVRAL